jgi:cytochrome c peroxidase
LGFVSTVMWDGRETVFGAIPGRSLDLTQSLTNQAIDATLGHAEGTSQPATQQLAQIVAFETALYTAQAKDTDAGTLNAQGATGGPLSLSTQSFYVGINDSLGGDPMSAQLTRTRSRSTNGHSPVRRIGRQ